MPVPIRCLDEELSHFAERFREHFSKPQYQYFVTVLLGLMLCEGRRTLSSLLREVAEYASLAGLSRFLSEDPWSQEDLVARWLTHLRQEMQFVFEAERHRQQSQRPTRRCPSRKAGRWKIWANTTRPPKTSASLAIVWYRGSMFCWAEAVCWLHSCIDRKQYVQGKT
jgi:hypothetical protein